VTTLFVLCAAGHSKLHVENVYAQKLYVTGRSTSAPRQRRPTACLAPFSQIPHDNVFLPRTHGAGMNSLNNLRTISPSLDELLAAYDAFGELPAMNALSRLVMIRRAVAVGFFNDDVPPAEQSSLSVTLPVT